MVAVCLLRTNPSPAQELVIKDDLERQIQLKTPAQRIVALYGAFNEILFAMGVGDRLVARTQADAIPPEITGLPSIGTHMRPNVERIVGLGPDLVLQMGGRKAARQSVDNLERFGVTTAMFHVETFEDLFSVIHRLGILTNAPGKAQDMIHQMRERLNAVRARLPHHPGPLVFFEVRSGNLLTAGQASIVTDIISHAGGKNCVELNDRLVRLSEEELLRLAPDVYLSQRGPMNPAPQDIIGVSRFATLPAVQNGNVHIVDEQMFSRPGPRNVDAVEQLAAILYPELFPEFAATAADTE